MTKKDIVFNVGMSGHYKLTVHSPSRGSRVVAEFKNLILDSGLNRFPVGSRLTHCQVGGGSAAPLVTDTALSSYIAGSSTDATAAVTSYTVGPPDYQELIVTKRFNPGVATGTIAEVGMGWAASGSLFSRSLILDEFEVPTTITILADETLDVEYRFRVYPPTADVVGTVNISGVDYDYVIRPAFVSNPNTNSLSGWGIGNMLGTNALVLNGTMKVYPSTSVLGVRTSSPSGGASTINPSNSNDTYSADSFQLTGTVTIGLGSGNVSGGIGAIVYGWRSGSDTVSALCAFQCSFVPPIPKDNTKVLTLDLKLNWVRM